MCLVKPGLVADILSLLSLQTTWKISQKKNIVESGWIFLLEEELQSSITRPTGTNRILL